MAMPVSKDNYLSSSNAIFADFKTVKLLWLNNKSEELYKKNQYTTPVRAQDT